MPITGDLQLIAVRPKSKVASLVQVDLCPTGGNMMTRSVMKVRDPHVVVRVLPSEQTGIRVALLLFGFAL